MKVTIRILLKNRHFTAINLIGLVIGICSFIIILSWVRHELSYDSFHENKDRLYHLVIKHPSGILDPNTPYAIAPTLANSNPEIEAYTYVRRLSTLSNYSFKFFPGEDRQIRAYEPDVVRVSRQFFDMFDFNTGDTSSEELLGRPESVVISSRIAEQYYDGINPVGQTVVMNNHSVLTITGVVDIPESTFFKFDFFLPEERDMSSDWNWRDPSYLLLKPGIDPENFREKISTFFNDNNPYNLKDNFSVQIIPISETYIAFRGRQQVFIFSCIAALLLIMAALNYMNLASANYVNRINEAGVRKVLGARAGSLRGIILTETYILAFIATIISLFIAEITLIWSDRFIGHTLEIGYLDNPFILPLIFVSVFLVLGLASAYPSSVFLGGNAVNSEKREFGASRKGIFILITVILQFTLTISLLISAFVIKNQINYSINKELGFSVDNVISIPMNEGIGDNFETFLERMESHPGIEEVTLGQSIPYDEDSKTNIDWVLKGTDYMDNFRYSICLRNYAELFGMKAIQGRLLSDDIETDYGKYLINQAGAKLLGFENPVGEYLTMWGARGEIIGVVEDFHHVSLHREIMPHIFNVNPRNYGALKFIFIKLSEPGNPETISFIESVCDDLASDWPFTYLSLEDEIAELYRNDISLVRIIGFFVLLTILLSVLSIYGLAYHSVEKKTREITIRKVYGASLGDNLILTYKKLFIQIGISFIIAIPLTVILMNNWLSNFAYSVKQNPSYFVISLLIAIVVAVITTTLAMWKTINRNPAENLKHN
ncbi:MAG: ABC transporter permease [Marinilabiliaceae bacterium]|jgi:ABC-type antimicrobial peptide transport system permease subunit|nr:ABC transporter permease [Marinilabiliaceae bacterium]